MKKTLISLGFVIILFSGCTINDTTVTVQGHATLLPWSTPISNDIIFLQDEHSLHKNTYYDRIETKTDASGFYKLSYTFNRNALLTLGYVGIPYRKTVLSSGTIQLKEGKQTINYNCYCSSIGSISLNDSSQLSSTPDSIIFKSISAIKTFKYKINNNYFVNPTAISIEQIAGYANTIECKVYRNGIYTFTDTILTPNSCSQTTQLNFNY
jgi:hypothetical protein